MNLKLLFFSILTLAAFSIKAQSLVFNTVDSIHLNETSVSSAEELLHKTYVKNVSTDTIDVSWRVNTLDATSGWDLSLCDKLTCLVLTPTTTNTFELAPGDSSELKTGYLANNIEGEALVRIRVSAIGINEPALFMTYTSKIDIDFTNVNDFSSADFSLYPNPVKDIISFNQGNYGNVNTFELYNVIGKKVFSADVNQTISNFNIANLNKGMYIAKVYGENSRLVYTQSFIKK